MFLTRSNYHTVQLSPTKGNSLIRGPRDVVNHILNQFDGPNNSFDCSVAHNLTFQIGGGFFSVDPRDFASPVNPSPDGSMRCSPALAATDPPGNGGFLYSWSLGDPFLKSALVAYYYGNLTHPSQDPPRIGLLSTVPGDVNSELQKAVQAAVADAGVFPAISNAAPSGTFMATMTGVGGVPQATHTDTAAASSNAAITASVGASSWMPSLILGAIVAGVFL